MKRNFGTFSAIALATGAVTAFGASSASASETWRFERAAAGGYAQSCDVVGGQRVCATVYCDASTDGLKFALTGWEPRGRGDQRQGSVAIDGRQVGTVYSKTQSAALGDVWQMNTRPDSPALVSRLKSGYRLAVDIAARAPAYRFTLSGSNDAISRLEQRCDRVERRQASYATPTPTPSGGARTVRIGDEDLGLIVRFGDRDAKLGPNWTPIATADVAQTVDRDVVDLGRRDGRFDALRFRALRNDIRVDAVVVTYGNGKTDRVSVDRVISQGDVSNLIELRGENGRFIDKVTFVYDTVSDGPDARLQIWGRRPS